MFHRLLIKRLFLKKIFPLFFLFLFNKSISQQPGNSSLPFSFGEIGPAFKHYKLYVEYADGKVDTISSQFKIKYLPQGGFQMYLLNNYDTIFPNQTSSAIRKYNFNGEDKILKGMPLDSLWLFPVIEGKITCYRKIPEYKNIHPSEINYIKKNNGEIQKFSHKLLKDMLTDNPEAMKMYQKKFFFKISGLATALAGGLICIAAISGGNAGMVLGGTVAMGVGFAIFDKGYSKKPIEAILVYNGGFK